MPLSKFDWNIAGPDRPQLGCAPPPGGGVEYKIEYTAENARLLHIVWNKVVLEHQPGGSAPAERSAIDFEGDSPAGRSPSLANLDDATWAVSFCTPGVFRLQATVVWISTTNKVKHVEIQTRVVTTESWPDEPEKWKAIIHRDPRCDLFKGDKTE